MTKSLWLLVALSSPVALGSELEARYAAISGLGEMNGVALQCKYLDQVRRMKQAVVASAPKERSFGLAFDQATHRSFLDFIARGEPCPGQGGFELRVGERIEALQRAFSDTATEDHPAGPAGR